MPQVDLTYSPNNLIFTPKDQAAQPQPDYFVLPGQIKDHALPRIKHTALYSLCTTSAAICIYHVDKLTKGQFFVNIIFSCYNQFQLIFL